MTETTISRQALARRNAILLDLAEWAGAQDARRRLGLVSDWAQDNWVQDRAGAGVAGRHCGTAACMAGMYAVRQGALPMRNLTDHEIFPDAHPFVPPGAAWNSKVVFPDGSEADVREYAVAGLLLSEAEANSLFDTDNNLNDVLHAIHKIMRTPVYLEPDGSEHFDDTEEDSSDW